MEEPPRRMPVDCCEDVGDVVRALVGRLNARREDVMVATSGEPKRVHVTVTQARSQSFRLVVMLDGSVALLGLENLGAREFRPHLVLTGTPAELVSLVTGAESWRAAVDAGRVIALEEGVDVEQLREVVATELVQLLGRPA